MNNMTMNRVPTSLIAITSHQPHYSPIVTMIREVDTRFSVIFLLIFPHSTERIPQPSNQDQSHVRANL